MHPVSSGFILYLLSSNKMHPVSSGYIFCICRGEVQFDVSDMSKGFIFGSYRGDLRSDM